MGAGAGHCPGACGLVIFTRLRAGIATPWPLLLSLLEVSACAETPDVDVFDDGNEPEILLPGADEWVDEGPLFRAGEPGGWDRYLWGGFTATAVRRDGEYLLYYQGSADYRDEYDPTVCYRSIGVARGTPEAGLEKVGDAPVLTWTPNEECEEGAAAGAAKLHGDDVLLYYGANTSTGRTTVSADVRLAGSTEGTVFEDIGVVLDHGDPDVWGGGDELFPLLALSSEEEHILYYVPNGTRFARRLGVARGSAPDRLDDTRGVTDPSGRPVAVWGPASYAHVGPGLMALFLKDGPDADIEVRLVDPSTPHRVSDPVRTYSFDDVRQATVVLDEERERWIMFYRTDDSYGLRTAPMRRGSGGRSTS